MHRTRIKNSVKKECRLRAAITWSFLSLLQSGDMTPFIFESYGNTEPNFMNLLFFMNLIRKEVFNSAGLDVGESPSTAVEIRAEKSHPIPQIQDGVSNDGILNWPPFTSPLRIFPFKETSPDPLCFPPLEIPQTEYMTNFICESYNNRRAHHLFSLSRRGIVAARGIDTNLKEKRPRFIVE